MTFEKDFEDDLEVGSVPFIKSTPLKDTYKDTHRDCLDKEKVKAAITMAISMGLSKLTPDRNAELLSPEASIDLIKQIIEKQLRLE